MKLLIAGGGTGGHLFPGLSVANQVRAQFPESQILFVGSQKPMDREVIHKAGFSFVPLKQHAAPKKIFSRQALFFLTSSVKSFWQAMREVIHFKPEVVLGLGGYASVAPVLSARFLGIPCVLFEANLQPGKANLFLSRFVSKIAVGFGVNPGYFTKNEVVITGIPVREGMLEEAKKITKTSPARQGFTLLVMGGSSGAQGLNRVVLEAYPQLQKAIPDLHVIHLSGKEDYSFVQERYRAMGANGAVECHPFISEMETVLKQADTVIARSGASSLAEFALFGLPALLVPYPHSTEAHQQSNALFFERHQAAKMVLEKDLSVSQLVSVITLWQRDTALRQRLCQASQQLGQSKATHKVIDLLCHVQAGKT